MAKETVLQKVGTGCFSLTFLWRFKKKEYIIKCPLRKGHFAYKKWFSHIQKEKFFLNEYALHQQKILVPKILEVTDCYIVQKKIEGVPLTEEIYNQLSLTEQRKIAHQLAFFFFKLHKKTTQDIPLKLPQKIFFGKLQKFFDEKDKRFYEKHRTLLKEKLPLRTFPCLCVADLKSSHILYDFKKKKLGLVDFGSIHFDFPESEFVLKNPIRSRLSLKMLKDMVLAYNAYQKKDIISWERLKSLSILYALKEVYTLYLEYSVLQKEQAQRIFYSFVQKIERL